MAGARSAVGGSGVLALSASIASFVLALGLAVGDEDLKLAGASGVALVALIALVTHVRARLSARPRA